MNKDIIPWPNYALCPGCSNRVPTPKGESAGLFSRKRTGEMPCPHCGETIRYARSSRNTDVIP